MKEPSGRTSREFQGKHRLLLQLSAPVRRVSAGLISAVCKIFKDFPSREVARARVVCHCASDREFFWPTGKELILPFESNVRQQYLHETKRILFSRYFAKRSTELNTSEYMKILVFTVRINFPFPPLGRIACQSSSFQDERLRRVFCKILRFDRSTSRRVFLI